MNRGRQLSIGIFSVGVIVLLAELASRFAWWNSEVLPPISRIILRAGSLCVDSDFQQGAILPSLLRLMAACCIACPFALLVAFMTSSSEVVRAAISPFIEFSYPVPKAALFPLALVFFGIGDFAKVILIAVGIFFPLYFSIASGLQQLRSSAQFDVVKVYRIRGWPLFRDFYWRGLLPDALVGLRLALGYGFTLVVVSEMTASRDGIGNFIWRAWDNSNLLDVHAGVFLLCLFSWFANWIVQRVR